MRQLTIKHAGGEGTVTIAFKNAPHETLQPGEETVVWVDDEGRPLSPVGLGPLQPPKQAPSGS